MTRIDLIDAVRTAVFAAAHAAHAAAGSDAAVCDHLLQDQRAPFVQVADLEWSNEGAKGEVAVRVVVDVVTVYQGADRARLLAMMAITEDAIDGVRLPAPAGAYLGPAELLGGGATGAASDGLTYAGQQSFEILAEAA